LQSILAVVAALKKPQGSLDDKYDADAITKGKVSKFLIGKMNFNGVSQAGIVRNDLN